MIKKSVPTHALVDLFKHALVTPVVNAMFHDKLKSLHVTMQHFIITLQGIPSAQELLTQQEKLLQLLHTVKENYHISIARNIINEVTLIQKHTLDDSSLEGHFRRASCFVKIISNLIERSQQEIEILWKLIDIAKDIGTIV